MRATGLSDVLLPTRFGRFYSYDHQLVAQKVYVLGEVYRLEGVDDGVSCNFSNSGSSANWNTAARLIERSML